MYARDACHVRAKVHKSLKCDLTFYISEGFLTNQKDELNIFDEKAILPFMFKRWIHSLHTFLNLERTTCYFEISNTLIILFNRRHIKCV